MTNLTIRDAQWPQDREAAKGFIDGSQRFEKAFEPNRRVDGAVAEAFIDELLGEMTKNAGIARIAQVEGRAVGWVVAWPETGAAFILEEERRSVFISELFVDEAVRGQGIGRALIAICEDWARARGIGILMIGVLARNDRAVGIYTQAGYAPYGMTLRKYIR
jgi:GNAT superfamily N-acetyltransferase